MSGIRLFAVRGIPVEAHWSLVLGLVLLYNSLLTRGSLLYPQLSTFTLAAAAAIASLLALASILLHELGHALWAKREGLYVDGIVLHVLGGFAFVGGSHSPKPYFRMIAAGPAVTALLLPVFGGFWALGRAVDWPDAVVGVAGFLALFQAVTLAFNLAPAFPLDGGQLLRAWLWQRTGDLLGATRVVVRVGFVVAFTVLAGGIVALAGGALALGWFVVVMGALMLLFVNAQSRVRVPRIPNRLATVADLLREGPVTAQDDLPVGEFLDRMAYARGHSTSPIPVEREGRLVGVMSVGLAREVGEADRAGVTVGEAMLRKEDAVTLDADTPIAEALGRLQQGSGRGVVLEQGRVTGIVLQPVIAQAMLEAADAERGKVPPGTMAW